MHVKRQIAGPHFLRKRGQRSRQPDHGGVQLLGMAHFTFVEMGKYWKVGVHGVEQPEVSNVRGGEIRQALIFLSPAGGKLRAAGREQLD